MQAIIPTVPSRSQPYAWGCISVNPDPPRVGAVTRITFPLANPGPDEVVIERIEARVAQFGIGVRWEELPPIGPFRLPPEPRRITEATLDWMPAAGGHRCVRATISVAGQAAPCLVGRNLHVIEAGADERLWSVPFRLGNPTPERAPLLLAVGGNHLPALEAGVRIEGRVVPLGEPVWLAKGQEVDAELTLRARLDGAFNYVRTLEARIHGRLIDGIHVTLKRPVLLEIEEQPPLAPEVVLVRDAAGAFAR